MTAILERPLFSKLASIVLIGVATAAAASETKSADAPTEGEKLFVLKVAPLFANKCVACHGDNESALEGGFDLRSRDTVLSGGDAFGDSVIVPGDAKASELMGLIRREVGGMEMPPKESEALSEEEIWAVRDWINAGAPWPDAARSEAIYRDHAAGVTVPTSGGLSPAWTQRKYDPADLWGWQPIRREFETLDGDDHPIDQFIEQAFREQFNTPEYDAPESDASELDTSKQALALAPPADRRTLIRRATFDLIGLPPTPDQIERFLDDPASDDQAFASLVDRLLDDPQYGVHWGRRWLDVVRYADSSGFANDWERPNAWRYRDYVIRSMNQDKPFDQFIREQLAGDELIHSAEAAGKTVSDQDRSEQRIAVGFLRMGAWEQTGMSVAKVTRQLFLDDITDTVGQVFLAQPLQCCRCHDHKFDPIPTRDFYSMQAVFATTQFAEVDAAWIEGENLSGMKEDRKYHELRRQEASRMLKDVNRRRAELEKAWFAENGLPYTSKNQAKKAGASEDELPPVTLVSPRDFGIERIGRKWQKRFSWESDRYRPIAFSVYNGKTRSRNNVDSRLDQPDDPMKAGTLEATKILTGGDPFADGETVTPGVLSALPGAMEVAIPDSVSGRRLALADWIADPDNALTSRVIANRIWAGHFGRGIAGNPNNFGATGKKPTHPELLDWLAGELVRGGWSIKALHRRIMNSDAYRRSTRHPDGETLAALDPNHQSYAVFLPRRLEAEELRDATLAVSGELNLAIGGIPVRPDMNLEAALQPRMIMGTFAPAWVPHPKPDQRNRRSVFIQNLRGHRMPFMETFNQPGSEVSCELRDSSNITPQVFSLFNGQESYDRAIAMAIRARADAASDREAVDRLFLWSFGRPASDREIDATLIQWQKMEAVQAEIKFSPTTYPVRVDREAVDENTGEPFTFSETLFAYQDYVADIGPHQVDAKTRALADISLAIINANEFVYVY